MEGYISMRRADKLIDYDEVEHGFVSGINTPREGWMKKAIAFWRKLMRRHGL